MTRLRITQRELKGLISDQTQNDSEMEGADQAQNYAERIWRELTRLRISRNWCRWLEDAGFRRPVTTCHMTSLSHISRVREGQVPRKKDFGSGQVGL